LRLIKGEPEPIESRFKIGYSSAAMLIQSLHDPQAIRKTIERSSVNFRIASASAVGDRREQFLRQREHGGSTPGSLACAGAGGRRQLALLQDSYWMNSCGSPRS